MTQSSNGKFAPITDYLKSSTASEITLTFSQIEKIIGNPLCRSARMYSAYWHPSKTHMLPLAWEDAGYLLHDLDMSSEMVTLVRREVGRN